MVKKTLVTHQEVIYVLREKIYSHDGKMSFYIAHVMILGRLEYVKTRSDYFHENLWKN